MSWPWLGRGLLSLNDLYGLNMKSILSRWRFGFVWSGFVLFGRFCKIFDLVKRWIRGSTGVAEEGIGWLGFWKIDWILWVVIGKGLEGVWKYLNWVRIVGLMGLIGRRQGGFGGFFEGLLTRIRGSFDGVGGRLNFWGFSRIIIYVRMFWRIKKIFMEYLILN